MYITMTILYCLGYVLVGSIISAPYTYLAGGNWESFGYTLFFSPIAAFILLMVWATDQPHDECGSIEEDRGYTFWVLLVYLFLPIILNGGSHLAKMLGWETISRGTFSLRYLSLVIVPAIYIGGVNVLGGIKSTWRWCKRSRLLNSSTSNDVNSRLSLEHRTRIKKRAAKLRGILKISR